MTKNYTPDELRDLRRGQLTHAGLGRPKGSVNKTTKLLKEAVCKAFDRAGGVDWLVKLANKEPKTFAMLLARVMPLQGESADTNGQGGLDIRIRLVRPDSHDPIDITPEPQELSDSAPTPQEDT